MRFPVVLRAAFGALSLTLSVAAARADVKLPALVGSGMVLQRDVPVKIWGWADDDEAVSVAFDGKILRTVAKGGRWEILLPKHAAGGPFTMAVSGRNSILLQDVLVGEVWVCGGQSNMEWALQGSFEPQAAIAASADDKLRLFNVKNARSPQPLPDVTGSWMASSPTSTPGFSAVGYYFGRALRRSLNVPVGLIQSDWGGTPSEAWVPAERVMENPVTKPFSDAATAAAARFPAQLKTWETAAAEARLAGKTVPNRPNAPWMPGELYNAMIDPIKTYSVRGAIWYQGESNGGRADAYRVAFPQVVSAWRDAFQNPGLYFFGVQLAPFQASGSGNAEYAIIREAIEMTGETDKRVGSVVITDIGEEKDIHPRKKQPVGERLALVARAKVYGEKILADGPKLKSWREKDGVVTVTFENAGKGLVAQPVDSRGAQVEGGKVLGFQVAGDDGKFVDADARVVGRDRVEIRASGVTKARAIRFGFVNFPNVNLWSADGLPAVPFRTDRPKD